MTKTFSDYGINISSTATPNANGEVYAICPWCSAQRKKKTAKCLSVNIDKGVWICNHCGIFGGLGKGNERPRDLHWQKPKFRRPEPRANDSLSYEALTWLLERGLTEAVITRNKIDSGNIYMPQVEDFAEAIIFPYFRNGELINRKYRTLDKNFRLDTQAELILYGLDDVNLDKVYWLEGEMDKLACEVAGVTSAVSVPNGVSAERARDYAALFNYLDADWEKIEAIKIHVIAVDNDEAGKRLEAELIRRLGVDKCLRVKWPEGCKDANDVLINHGSDELRFYLDSAEPYPIEGVVEVSDKIVELARFYEDGLTRGVATGWQSLDEFYSVRPGRLTVITGVPGSGKSNWLDCMLINIAQACDWRFAIFSPENLPVEQHMAYLAEKFLRKPVNTGPTPRMTPDEFNTALGWIDNHFSWILPNDESQWEIDNILKIAGQLCLRYGIRGLVIDPWNEIEPMRPEKMSETEYISQSLKRIRVFARLRDVHVWVVAHPAKQYRDKNGESPVPTLYDISGSANFRNKADNGIVVWRDLTKEDSPEVQIHIQKIRFRPDGKRGICRLQYERICATYCDSEQSSDSSPSWFEPQASIE